MQSLWMLVASALFAVMAACVKLAAAYYSIAELVLYRSAIGVLALFVYARAAGLSIGTPVAGVHLRRAVAGVAALALWFYSISGLPMGTAMTLNFASTLFLTAFTVAAALWARRHVAWMQAFSVGAGFIGVILVLQPSFGAGQEWPALAGLLSGLLSAVAYWHVKHLGSIGEPEWRTVFYFSLSGVLLGLAGAVAGGITTRHSVEGVLLVLGVGLFALLGQLAMTRAYGRGRTLLAANLQFSAIVFAAMIGLTLFSERIAPAGWIGIAVIIASGIAATVYGARGRPARLLGRIAPEPQR
jgi:S-adenosylmethionine uptake transporter